MLPQLIHNIRTMAVSLRFSMLFIFVTLFIVSMTLIILITSIRFTDTITYTSKELMDYESRAVLHQLTSAINPAEKEAKFTASLIETGVLTDDEKKLIPYTFLMTKKFPLIFGAFWADEHGDYIYAVEDNDGSIITEVYKRNTQPNYHETIFYNTLGEIVKRNISPQIDFDPRLQSWYLGAKNATQTVWSDLYTFHLKPTQGITTTTPVTIDGKFHGIFGINISLHYLSDFITNQKVSEHGFSFIITTNEKLIAYPNKPPFNQLKKQDNELIDVHDISLPLIDASLDYYKKTQQSDFSFSFQGEKYLATYIPVKELANYGWLVGVIVPVKDFTDELNKMFLFSLALSLVILILSLIVISMLVTRIVKPIRALVKETEHIKNFELNRKIDIQSRIKEVIYLRNALKAMKNGLRSFQKYVPKSLVRQLIDSGADIRVGGAKRQIVILFTDIENFTTIAEIITPNELMAQLSEYFEYLSEILLQEKATIDKYIGDSIMAFWGAPAYVENAPFYAAEASVLCQKKLQELNSRWLSEGKPAFITRIGIHFGEAIVGNIGSSERLNYTALGDVVNMASRLEKINKKYQTRIIVSDEIYQEIKEQFVLRFIDCVAVKGKMKSNYLYELLGKNLAEIPFDIITYREIFDKGFECYQSQQWDKAISYFQQCKMIYPNDTIAPLFIKRCEHFKNAPPPSEWQGVAKLDA